MLGVGWTEMLVIGVMALIVIGPKDLPMVMQKIGQFVGTVRRMGNEFQREINKTTGLDEVRNLRNSITGPLKKTSEEIRKDFNAMTPAGPKPSGVIKPADPSREDVVAEIRSAAGLPPVERAAGESSTPATSAAPAAATPVPQSTVTAAPLPASGVASDPAAPSSPDTPAKSARKPAPVKTPRKAAADDTGAVKARRPRAAKPTGGAEPKAPAKRGAARKSAATAPPQAKSDEA